MAEHEDLSDLPWVEKYRPRLPREMVGFRDIVAQLKKVIETVQRNNALLLEARQAVRAARPTLAHQGDLEALKRQQAELKKSTEALQRLEKKAKGERAALLIGPPGVGKTTVVYCLANELGMDVYEMNSSDARTEAAITEALAENVRNTNLLSFISSQHQSKIILVDEVDGIHGQIDRGGVKTLLEFIERSRFPVIMACNFDERSISSLKKVAKVITIKPLPPNEVLAHLMAIAKKEALPITADQIDRIVEHCRGDLRSCINDLQALASGISGDGDSGGPNMDRDISDDEWAFVGKVFSGTTLAEHRQTLNASDVDLGMRHRWIAANVDVFMADAVSLRFAWENLAQADRIMGRLLRVQDYSMLPFANDLMTAGVTLAATRPPVRGKRLNFVKFYRKASFADNECAERIQAACVTSLPAGMRETLPLLRLLSGIPDTPHRDNIIAWLQLGADAAKLLDDAAN
jgi:replication factor C large subunit